MTNFAVVQNTPEPAMADGYRDVTGSRMISNHRPVKCPTDLYTWWINELWAGRRKAQDLVSPDFVGHWPTQDVHGPEELQTVIDDTRGSLRELAFVVDVGPFTVGDMVAARWIGTGSTKKGPARLTGNDILRIANGKVVEYWSGTSSA